MNKTIRRFAALVIGTFALAACSDSSGTGTGMLTVRLTDAPFPFSDVARVDVFVVRVDARTAATTDAQAADAANHDGWTTVATPNASINLLDLGSGKTMNLGATTLATGNYNGFRLILDTGKSKHHSERRHPAADILPERGPDGNQDQPRPADSADRERLGDDARLRHRAQLRDAWQHRREWLQLQAGHSRGR